ncbi:polymorphic toxin-type HINT domain-containing protein [Amycolatopsis sp. NPDC058340]|uniref:polymorphic toxin-type HINT domain-containing protein n=1 Tax=Amycolatopsis sp. NPDC058340 TaxID=3346453 RepID=UPI003662147D
MAVLAKDPTTGRTAVRVVTDARSHASKRTLVEVGVASEAGRGSVVATDEHPFWVESEKRWSHAVDLKAGHRLETGAPEAACLSCQSVLARRGAKDLSR